ncbi:hypothetical protein B0J13DRAFT_270210 [Dactylonectria estremocensis]|uniref:MARVEL domain-containing protein n=1 Tax=Dactylonectria estremocensis TaxID=1079267 RepID=A0A9P9D3V2_9HYPO|nr:hypothetical protein B0J13DRAFT_270210 [Dactylonectria estremocensis]
MARSGGAHKIASVILRFLEFCCAVIVLGLLSRFVYLVGIAGVHCDGRIIYAIVVASIGTAYSILLCAPFDALFLSFPFDFVLFVMWLVAYCLLQSRTGGHTCSANWYYNYWGYYWGRFWTVGPIGRVNISGAGCAQWRTVLAFSCIAWFLHLLSGILGIYVLENYIQVKDTVKSAKQQMRKMSHSYPPNGRNRDSTNVEAGQDGTNPTQPRSEV